LPGGFSRSAQPGASQGAVVGQPFLGRRYADRSLSQHEELSSKDGSDKPWGPGRNGERDFHGEKRSNETHASTTATGTAGREVAL